MVQAEKPRVHTTLGFSLMGIGAVFAIMDQLLAGCVASGPCIPLPPFPIVLPLGIYATGVAWGAIALWEDHVSKTR